MAAILTSVLVLLGILVLMSKGGLPSGGRSRLVLHYPASGPSPSSGGPRHGCSAKAGESGA